MLIHSFGIFVILAMLLLLVESCWLVALCALSFCLHVFLQFFFSICTAFVLTIAPSTLSTYTICEVTYESKIFCLDNNFGENSHSSYSYKIVDYYCGLVL